MSRAMGLVRQRPRPAAFAAAVVLLLGVVAPVRATLLTSHAAVAVVVNSSGDAVDALPGDGVCDTGLAASDGTAACTLRAAIAEANASAVDTIQFAVPATDPAVGPDGVVTIAPAAPLPSIGAATVLDATTQPGWAGTPRVELDGATAGSGAGITVLVGPSVVAGLAVHSFPAEGVLVRDATDTVVRDNHLGVDAGGLVAPGNGAGGVRVDGGLGNAVRDNLVGGNTGHGVAVVQGPDAVVTGNRIGVAVDGTAIGNGGDGIEVAVPSSSDVRIGGTAPGEGNTVAHNAGPGVVLRTGGLGGVSVLGNSVFANGGLGIDLNDDGLTANDLLDADGGTNGSLNTPVPTSATDSAVTFDLDVPAGDYRVEVFRNPTEGADPLGAGEGEELVGAGTVTHAGGGTASFTVTGLAGALPGDVLSLTATEDLGAGDHGATSEFSATVTAVESAATVNDTGDAADAAPGDGTCATGGTNAEGVPACTLRAALQEAMASALVTDVRFGVPTTDPGNVDGVVTIRPGTALPTITTGVLVDGSTQPGFAAAPVVVLDGAAVGHLLTVTGDDTTVRSVALRGAGGDGLRVDGAARVLLVGGEVTGNGGNGVTVLGTADDVAVVDTVLRDNGGLAIDLADDGVTPNDAGDGDSGPNGLLNHPVVVGASASGGTVALDVRLDAPAGDVLLQVHTTTAPDQLGAGEGDAVVHAVTVAHPGGAATHGLSFAGDLTRSFTLTATEDLGGGTYGSTSEFSAAATRPVAADDPGAVPSLVAAATPLSYWRLGEDGGTTAVDGGSLGNDGTLLGGATPGATGALAGDDDTAVELDGTDDVVVVPHDPAYLLDQGTVSLWVWADALGTTRVPFSKDSAGLDGGGHVDLRIEPDGTVVHRLGTTTAEVEVASAPGAVGTGAWHHLAVTFGPRGTELWVDGERAGWDAHDGGWGTTAGGSGNLEPITLGASGADSGDGSATPATDWFDGRIDEVAVIGTQLDGATIAEIAGAAAQHYVTDGGALLTVPASAGVLANDHDPDGEALTAALVTPPANASSFTLQPDGSFAYASSTVGTDTFTYTVSDGVMTSEAATATVIVLPGHGERVIDDATGNGHDGTPAGGMTSADAVAGKVGGALDLDGADDRIAINNLDVAGNALTLSAWVDPDTIGTDPSVLAKTVGLAGGDVEWRLLLADTSATTANATGSVRTTSGLASAIDPGSTGTDDGWVHLTARYDGSEVVLFVDGTPVASTAHAGALRPDPAVSTWIGGTPGGGAFDGRIDEVRVSSVARSDAWVAATHATQADPAAAVTVGATQTSAPGGWSTSTAQARSGSSSALAPSGVLRSWLTLDGLDEAGLEAVAWWRVNTLTGLDLGQGLRAGDAAGLGPVRQDETGLFDATGFDLGQVDGARTRLVAPPAGQSPEVDAWQRVVLRISPTGALSATADGADVPASGSTAAGVAPSGTFGLRVGQLDPAARWWVDDLRLRRFVSPEPVATLRRTELAP